MGPPSDRTKVRLWPFVVGALALLAIQWAMGSFPDVRGANRNEGVGEVLGGILCSVGLGVFVWALVDRRWILGAAIGGTYVSIVAVTLLVMRPWEHKEDRAAVIRGCITKCRPRIELAVAAPGDPLYGASAELADLFCQAPARKRSGACPRTSSSEPPATARRSSSRITPS